MPLSKTGSYNYFVEPFHCDFADNLFICHLCNAMLNAADLHSNERGMGIHYLKTINRTWVLSRLCIELYSFPKSYEHVQIDTWIENAMKYFTLRNFAVHRNEGNDIGFGRSVWAMIDTLTRQPTDILSVKDGLIADYIETEKTCPIDKPSRVKILKEPQLFKVLEMNYSDVDVNGHVNSVKYIEHILDMWDIEWYSLHRVKRFEIAYTAETHQGDYLKFYKEKNTEGEYLIRVTKKNNSSTENDLEVCRCRVTFVNIVQ